MRFENNHPLELDSELAAEIRQCRATTANRRRPILRLRDRIYHLRQYLDIHPIAVFEVCLGFKLQGGFLHLDSRDLAYSHRALRFRAYEFFRWDGGL